ncbi:MAG: S8/S53 family peptidase [Shimia sp.]
MDTTNPEGLGSYPTYDARWHFAALGLPLERCFVEWDRAMGRGRPTRVALIDGPVAGDHPNLQDGALAEGDRRDFALEAAGLRAALEGVAPDGAEAALRDWIGRMPAQPGSAPNHAIAGSHGTAMAGLIAARPAMGAEWAPGLEHAPGVPGRPDRQVADALRPMPLPYSGIDPTATLLPISVGAQPAPVALMAALLWAERCGADMIVLALDVQRPGDPHFPADAITLPPGEDALWDPLEALLVRLSRTRPVLCAAGNMPGGADEVAWPARIAARDNGIFAVGATDAHGRPAAYGPDAPVVSLTAPSGDGERVDRAALRLDVLRDDFGQGAEAPWADPTGRPAGFETTAPEALVTTDVPGRFGKGGSAFGAPRLPGTVAPARVAWPAPRDRIDTLTRETAEALLELDVYFAVAPHFCLFSGTSGATAVAAGVVSLAISTGRLAPSDVMVWKDRIEDLRDGRALPIHLGLFDDAPAPNAAAPVG